MHQVSGFHILYECIQTGRTSHLSSAVLVLQELAGFTGGNASFLKEDFEIQLNKTLFWDSVRF